MTVSLCPSTIRNNILLTCLYKCILVKPRLQSEEFLPSPRVHPLLVRKEVGGKRGLLTQVEIDVPIFFNYRNFAFYSIQNSKFCHLIKSEP